MDIEKVAALVRSAAQEEIVPRFGRLSAGDIREKQPNDLVTVADEAMEERLTRSLSELLPGSLVVGEEAVAADPSVIKRLDGKDAVWVIDPLDGTGNFAVGRPVIATLLALVKGGRTIAGWIYDPLADLMVMVEAGGGVRGSFPGNTPEILKPADWRGSFNLKFFPPHLRQRLEQDKKLLTTVEPLFCAGHDYIRLMQGRAHFSLFYRTLPWDHAAGALLLTELGGKAARFDGRAYAPVGNDEGLLITRNADEWETVRTLLKL